MTGSNIFLKRLFDIIFSSFILVLFGWLILLLWLIVCVEIKENGFFTQTRFGQYGKPFTIFKIKTMKSVSNLKDEKRISKIGKFLRKTKLDEFPQFWNILKGDMSVVGPRPDFLSLLDALKEEDKIILAIKPGLTGPAQLEFFNEEEVLTKQSNPDKFNREIIWPKKVELNKKYIQNYSLLKDIGYILKTVNHL